MWFKSPQSVHHVYMSYTLCWFDNREKPHFLYIVTEVVFILCCYVSQSYEFT